VLSCYKYVLFSVVLSTPANKWKTCWAASNHSSLAQRNFKQKAPSSTLHAVLLGTLTRFCLISWKLYTQLENSP
jgi:hypothetical protein